MVKAGKRKCQTTVKANWNRARSSALGKASVSMARLRPVVVNPMQERAGWRGGESRKAERGIRRNRSLSRQAGEGWDGSALRRQPHDAAFHRLDPPHADDLAEV